MQIALCVNKHLKLFRKSLTRRLTTTTLILRFQMEILVAKYEVIEDMLEVSYSPTRPSTELRHVRAVGSLSVWKEQLS